MPTPNYVCIHGHFYQPPRVNPFTGTVGEHDGAEWFGNWNERITAECYEANTKAPILGADGLPRLTVNNYSWMSWDFGPTLLSWLDENAPDTYASIVDADRQSVERFGGHGSGMAHAYNHAILPLANHRDRITQVRWGIADFVHRFGRPPEGFWLPEAAVDTETLRILHDEEIRFTVLSPYQATGSVDPRIPYRVHLGGEEYMGVFFYDGPLSQDIAFNGLLDDGRIFAKRLIQALGEPTDRPLLANVATDGESYGHHHRFGEMALAAAIEEITEDSDVAMTNYGQFLALRPPTETVHIIEGSSWSCSHGVERWRADCGCSSGAHPEWSQMWRGPQRAALDWLRDSLAIEFERHGRRFFSDPWAVRDDYIRVLLGEPEEEFMERHSGALDDEARRLALGLLEIQHRAMLMYTSCGWFFDDISGLESVLVLRQAGRAIQLSREILGRDLEPGFLAILDGARSNHPGLGGREIYESRVRPYMAGS